MKKNVIILISMFIFILACDKMAPIVNPQLVEIGSNYVKVCWEESYKQYGYDVKVWKTENLAGVSNIYYIVYPADAEVFRVLINECIVSNLEPNTKYTCCVYSYGIEVDGKFTAAGIEVQSPPVNFKTRY